MDYLKESIRDVPDFPTKGIVFKDITPLLRDAEAFRDAIDAIAEHYEGQEIDIIMGAEARGFIIAGALAYKLGAGFVPARKAGKLPYNVTKAEFEMSYGPETLEMHSDAIKLGERVLIVDDVLATGGTAAAKADLVEQAGGQVVGLAFLLELLFLKGREKIKEYNIFSLLQY